VTSVFLDTGYVIALEAADDQYHDAAVQHWRGLSTQLPPLVTTSYVFDEVVTFSPHVPSVPLSLLSIVKTSKTSDSIGGVEKLCPAGQQLP